MNFSIEFIIVLILVLLSIINIIITLYYFLDKPENTKNEVKSYLQSPQTKNLNKSNFKIKMISFAPLLGAFIAVLFSINQINILQLIVFLILNNVIIFFKLKEYKISTKGFISSIFIMINIIIIAYKLNS